MSNFSVSPVGVKTLSTATSTSTATATASLTHSTPSTHSTQQSKFTHMIQASNQSRINDQKEPKQTKFIDMISSTNHTRLASEKQKETIAALTAQMSELKKTHARECDGHIETERQLRAELKASCNKLLSVETVYKNLSSDQSGLQLQLQEAKDCLHVAQRTAMEQIQSQDEKLAALQKKYDACAKENEEMLASWDNLRVVGEEQAETIKKQDTELTELRDDKKDIESKYEKLLSDHETILKEQEANTKEITNLRSHLEKTQEDLASLQQSLRE